MGVLLGLVAATLYGVSDFAGGIAAKRAALLTVVLSSELAALVVLLAVLPWLAASGPTGEGLYWGAGAGVAGTAGIALLYRGLAAGRMAIVAPVSAVVGALVPVAVGLFSGERPSLVAFVGVAVALVAVALVASAAGDDAPAGGSRPSMAALSRSGLFDGLGAGVGFGLLFVLYAAPGPDSGPWPVVGSKVASLLFIGTLAAARRSPIVPPRASLGLVVTAGGLGVTANVLYLVAARNGLLSLVAVVTALYPAATVTLARFVLHERLGRAQLVGIVLALGAVALIATG